MHARRRRLRHPRSATFTWCLALLAAALPTRPALGAPRVLPAGTLPADQRLGPPKDLNGYFPFVPSATPRDWAQRAELLRRHTQVALGLWPMPAKTPARAVVHGLVDRPDFTVERVYLESFPGHFVTGSLFRPKGREGKRPGVLCPHGHWANGRFFDAGVDAARNQIVQGAERFESGGRHPLQARCMQLARMGCVVFHYDMLGYADSQQISFAVAHRYKTQRPEMDTPQNWGFFSTQAELRLQSIMGLQTYNSIRALDWLSELSDVDPQKIGVTGASGGGTQTFILCAVDPRPAVQFPAVMVSTAMQGGCTCENCSLLRVGTGNVELAALFAPKPLGMSGADDWTKEIMTKGLPELQQHYKLLGAEKNVMAKALVQFPHNYNYVSRGLMYSWFNKHLQLGFKDPIIEEDFTPLSRDELTVWDGAHPPPPAGDDYERSLLRTMTEDSARQMAALRPADAESLARFREVAGGGVQAIFRRGLPPRGAIAHHKVREEDRGDYLEFASLLRYGAAGEEVPAVFLHPKNWNKQVVVWLDQRGKEGLFGGDGSPRPDIARLLKAGAAVAGLDLFGQGEFTADGEPLRENRRVKTDREFAGFTYGYNDPLFTRRVHDVLTMVSFVRSHEEPPQRVSLVGLGEAGPWAAAAAALAPGAIDRAAIDTGGFRFASLTSFWDERFVPGIVKYGDLPALLALAAPAELWLAGEDSTAPDLAQAAYRAAGAEARLSVYRGAPDGRAAAALDWLLR